MTAEQAELLDRLIAQPYGAVLVAGPVGAGKTSTLYNCLERINSPPANVMTIEDPIEHRIPGVNQTQVNSQGDMGFSEGLRAMLRQDPDVIMIGEIRDDETARIGIRAALTGVLVFSTIHGSDCAQHDRQPLQLRHPRLPALQQPAGDRLAAPDPQDLPVLPGHLRGRREGPARRSSSTPTSIATCGSTAAWAARRASRPATWAGPGSSRSWWSARSCAT